MRTASSRVCASRATATANSGRSARTDDCDYTPYWIVEFTRFDVAAMRFRVGARIVRVRALPPRSVSINPFFPVTCAQLHDEFLDCEFSFDDDSFFEFVAQIVCDINAELKHLRAQLFCRDHLQEGNQGAALATNQHLIQTRQAGASHARLVLRVATTRAHKQVE